MTLQNKYGSSDFERYIPLEITLSSGAAKMELIPGTNRSLPLFATKEFSDTNSWTYIC